MKIKKGDIVLIAALLLVAGGFFLGNFLLKQGTKEPEAVVMVNGDVYAKYPLSENLTVEIPGKIGTNTLIIQDGEAYMAAAACPDKICMKHGKIRYNKQQIVCAPGGIVVIIENGETSELDAIVQ